MTPRQRIAATLLHQPTDRVAMLGGFLVAEKHYRELTDTDEAAFDADPQAAAIEANRRLGVDGLILLRLPPGKGGHMTYRGMTKEGFEGYRRRFACAEDVLAWVEKLPAPDEALRQFDAAAWKVQLAEHIRTMQSRLGEMQWLPTQWDVVHPTFEHYNFFGYDNYMEFIGLHPAAAGRLFGWEVEVKRAISAVVVEVYRELDVLPLVHIGSDICGKNGPVVSPAFLREHYFPHVRRCIEPLVEAGFTTVWHADGVIGPIVDDILACGVSGFQGFQWEYGFDLESLLGKRTIDGKPLTIFAGASTSSTLPFGTLDDVRREVEHIIDTAYSKCALFILPGNDVLPDTPTEHVIEMYRSAARYSAR